MSQFGRGVFITGTDTDVGKTVTAAAVLVAARRQGIDAVPMKPVQSGAVCRDGVLTSPDLQFCLQMAGLPYPPADAGTMVPYLFEPACSPHLAAAECGCEISFERIGEVFEQLLQHHAAVIAEGAGGLLVPLGGDGTMLDLMVLLKLPVIVVARPGLGTINHTLLSLRELRRKGLPVLGVVFCETASMCWGPIENDNWRTIERLGEIPVLGRIPFLPGLAEGRVAPQDFRDLAIRYLQLPFEADSGPEENH